MFSLQNVDLYLTGFHYEDNCKKSYQKSRLKLTNIPDDFSFDYYNYYHNSNIQEINYFSINQDKR